MVGSADHLDPRSGCQVCPVCGYRVDPEHTSSNFKLKQKRYDISTCYDGAIIVSQKLKDAFSHFEGRMLKFEELPNVAGFFHLKCLKPIALNYEAMRTERGRFCEACRKHRDFVGFSKVILRPEAELSNDCLAFSDCHFGSNNEASPLLIAGEKALETIQKEGLKGVASYAPISTQSE